MEIAGLKNAHVCKILFIVYVQVIVFSTQLKQNICMPVKLDAHVFIVYFQVIMLPTQLK